MIANKAFRRVLKLHREDYRRKIVQKMSAGLLLFRYIAGELEILLVHPGGPYWTKKDEGAWSVPKGEFTEGDDPFEAAKREFQEETGQKPPTRDAMALRPLRQPSGKLIFAWAVKGDFNTATLKSNTFSMEWPPGSGRQEEFPEVDKAEWFSLEEAKRKISKGQVKLIEQIQEKIEETEGK